MWGRVVPSLVIAGALVVASAGVARAQDGSAGHFTVEAGTLASDDANGLTFRALLRTELAFRVAGPLAIGGFFQALIGEDPMGQAPPGFGGGLIVALRPVIDRLPFRPHLELTGARVQIPSLQSLVEAWAIGLGGGAGAEIVPGVTLEARVHHQWWIERSQSSIADHAWSFAAAVTVDLP